MTDWSQYHKEFQEISFIASGGFGNVFKALHRLDGTEYAVKKIIVRSGRVKNVMQHLEEVKTLAKLNHTNIVSYKGAWIEPTLPSFFIPSLVSASHSQSRISSIEHARNGNYSSRVSQSFNTTSQQISSNTWSSDILKESDDRDMLSQHSNIANGKSSMCNCIKQLLIVQIS